MKKRLLNDRWCFARLPLNDDEIPPIPAPEAFAPVDLPHDFCIYRTEDFYKDTAAYYRMCLKKDEITEAHAFLCFDGVYMDNTLFVNGEKAGEWKYGYSAFSFDLAPFLTRENNEIILRVLYRNPNSRWYSGGGIFRDVVLIEKGADYLPLHGTYVHSEKQADGWHLTISAEAVGGDTVLFRAGDTEAAFPVSEGKAQGEMILKNGRVWDIDDPQLYDVSVQLLKNGKETDTDSFRVGLREYRFDCNEGFFLNGRHVKLHGVCLHHDLGALGSAYNKTASRRQLQLMKRMGVNAIRTSHNMPASDFMDLCDEMGFLVDSEAFDMWENPKTKYDYSRFFREWMPRDVENWVRRDRNHASVIMWSMGNEIYDTHGSPRGMECMLEIREQVWKHDPLHNGMVTIGSNYIPWEATQKCADVLKLIGYNYAERYYDEHHKKYPDWMIYGSETSSIVQSRGIYHFPASENILADDDLQCSSLNNSFTSWGAKSIDYCITADRDAPQCAGQFVWTGTDYLGEPTPYHTKNSYFGFTDTAGFEKDIYYIFKAAWNDEPAPFVHLWPYWDFNEGQMIDVFSVSNQKEMRLFLNGRLMGTRRVDAKKDAHLCADWRLPYEKGVLEVKAYDENGRETASERHVSFGDAASLEAAADKTKMKADGRDMIFLDVTATDENGNLVENAVSRVQARVEGAARLAGMDAGDSTDDDSFKQDHRRMFSGHLLVMLMATKQAGEITVTLTSPGLKEKILHLEAVECPEEEKAGVGDAERILPSAPITEIPIRKIELSFPDGKRMSRENPSIRVQAKVLPQNANYSDLVWRLVNDRGIDVPFATIKTNGTEAVITGRYDGSLRVRCMAMNGKENACVISQMELECEGLGGVRLNPYGFLSMGLKDVDNGATGAGNERGIATAGDRETIFGFSAVDFGDYGSDEVTIPIFALDSSAHRLEIWDGDPREEGSECVCRGIYEKPSIWNVYQSETFRLTRRMKGIRPLFFAAHDKFHLKGMEFKEYKRAFSPLDAGDFAAVYGDSYTCEGTCLKEIGNNVVIDLGEMDFENSDGLKLSILGHSPIPCNTVHVRFTAPDGSIDSIPVEFTRTDAPCEKSFLLPGKRGKVKTELVFLPGSRFDLHRVTFSRDE